MRDWKRALAALPHHMAGRQVQFPLNQKAAEEQRAARAERARKASKVAKAKREKTAKERAAYAACLKGSDPICGDEGQRLKDACEAVGLSGDGCLSLDE
jgi:hypothetical protein